MRFAKYWAKGFIDWKNANPATGEMENFFCWGWSDESPDAAAAKGRERALKVAEMIRSGQRPDRYTYGDRPFKEEKLREWVDQDGVLRAAITINSYGCHVMNTTRLMFVDVDLPEKTQRTVWEPRMLDLLDKVLASQSGYGAHVYRTAGGLRYVLTQAESAPRSEAVRSLMEQLGADPLYIKLCRIQQCFRARLSPKSWRCGLPAIKIEYPCCSEASRQYREQWKRKYDIAAAKYAVCERIGFRGNAGELPKDEAELLALHDETTKARSGLPLA